MWRWLALTSSVVLGAALVWLAGFSAYERNARTDVPPPPVSDGIVALTGGADRIETAFRLFTAGKAPRLLISGVGGTSGLSEVMRRLAIDRTVLTSGVVTLGRDATDTVGNAAETASWARQNGVHTLIVVTAGYHMARALLEIARELPNVELRPVAVRPPALRSPDDLATLRLLANEYDKYLVVRFGLNRWPTKGIRP